MNHSNFLFLLTFVVLVQTVHSDPAGAAKKKLIEFGWDEPDTTFMREHVAEMERTPFDGCVFHVDYPKPGGKGSFTWECWGERAFAAQELQPALDDLKATRFRRFTDNFLRFNTTPGKLDWFEDHAAVLTNAYLAARVAREGKCRGLLFDIEQYEGPLFDYRKQREAKQKSWEMYAAQVRRRGRETMEAFQRGCPNLTVFLTFGYSLPWAQSQGGKIALAECHYGLLAPFLDGMVEASRGGARLVDGHELSYGYKDLPRFSQAYQTMTGQLLPIVLQPDKYRRVFSFGFGLWMDHDWRKAGWDINDPSKNFYSPEAFEASVRKALETADEYVWIYTETPRWWSKEGTAVKLPAAYDAALRRARKGLAKD
ncbi:MAG: hypothetical protein HY674_04175 [Chloroflexi bacterium]|nr:hypothetical protein [Chloroflexota bacterium]